MFKIPNFRNETTIDKSKFKMKSAKLRNPDAVGIAILCCFEIRNTEYRRQNTEGGERMVLQGCFKNNFPDGDKSSCRAASMQPRLDDIVPIGKRDNGNVLFAAVGTNTDDLLTNIEPLIDVSNQIIHVDDAVTIGIFAHTAVHFRGEEIIFSFPEEVSGLRSGSACTSAALPGLFRKCNSHPDIFRPGFRMPGQKRRCRNLMLAGREVEQKLILDRPLGDHTVRRNETGIRRRIVIPVAIAVEVTPDVDVHVRIRGDYIDDIIECCPFAFRHINREDDAVIGLVLVGLLEQGGEIIDSILIRTNVGFRFMRDSLAQKGDIRRIQMNRAIRTGLSAVIEDGGEFRPDCRRIRVHSYRVGIRTIGSIAEIEGIRCLSATCDGEYTRTLFEMIETSHFNEILAAGLYADGQLGLLSTGIIVTSDQIFLKGGAFNTFIDGYDRIEAAAACADGGFSGTRRSVDEPDIRA